MDFVTTAEALHVVHLKSKFQTLHPYSNTLDNPNDRIFPRLLKSLRTARIPLSDQRNSQARSEFCHQVFKEQLFTLTSFKSNLIYIIFLPKVFVLGMVSLQNQPHTSYISDRCALMFFYVPLFILVQP